MILKKKFKNYQKMYYIFYTKEEKLIDLTINKYFYDFKYQKRNLRKIRIVCLERKVKDIKCSCIVIHNAYFDVHKKQTIEG